jgi:ABC-2 type transport system permease protein
MIQIQLALLRRELWEHRSLYLTPIVIALLVTLMALTGNVSIGAMKHVDLGIVGASNMPENARAAALTVGMLLVSSMFVLAMSILIIFYTLDSLYAERKDRSILFWRSMPLTDFETVLSKFLTAVLLIPLVTFVLILLTHIVVLLITSVWIAMRGGDAWHLIWSAAPFLEDWSAILVLLLALPLWMSPFIGWFLFVSAFVKRSPLLIAFLPIAMLPMFEKLLFDSTVFVEAFFVRSVQMPLFTGLDNMKLFMHAGEDLEMFEDASLSLLSLMDLGGFLASPSFWLGIVVCGLFTTAAIYVRRYRDDS